MSKTIRKNGERIPLYKKLFLLFGIFFLIVGIIDGFGFGWFDKWSASSTSLEENVFLGEIYPSKDQRWFPADTTGIIEMTFYREDPSASFTWGVKIIVNKNNEEMANCSFYGNSRSKTCFFVRYGDFIEIDPTPIENPSGKFYVYAIYYTTPLLRVLEIITLPFIILGLVMLVISIILIVIRGYPVSSS